MGKSIVLARFEKLGAITLDADKIVEDLLSQQEVLEKIRGIMGSGAFNADGRVNKKKVADLIFKNDILKSSFEDLLHPLVFGRIEDFLKTLGSKKAVVVVEVPLLFERGYEKRFDRTITVHTNNETAFQRLEKDGVTREEAMQRLRSQLPVEEKMKKSDFLINNDGTPGETLAQVSALYEKFLQEARIGNNKRD